MNSNLTPNPGPPEDPAMTPVVVTNCAIWDALHHVIDPELGVNLVDLGLIYSVVIEGGRVRISMTVTTPGCPMEQSLVFGVETAVLVVPGVESVEVDVVRDPPWSPDMMSEEGRAAAGIRGSIP